MIPLNNYITIRKGSSTIKVNDKNVFSIVREQIKILGNDADLNHIDVSDCTHLTENNTIFTKGLFENTDFCGDVSEWKTEKCTNMNSMFAGCSAFNCDLSNWDVSNVIQMRKMFYKCYNFEQDLSMWDTKSARNMTSMFEECWHFRCDLSKWDVSKVFSFERMFYHCTNFDSDLSGWDVSSANMYSKMFTGVVNLKNKKQPKFNI